VRVREIFTVAELARVCADDTMIVWAGQGLGGPVRAWHNGDAVAVATPDLSQRDRLSVWGPIEELVPLVEQVLAEVGTSFRPFGDEALVRELAERILQLRFAAAFGWMNTATAPSVTVAAQWLDGDAGVEAVLTSAAPGSYAWPGRSGVRRWAGVTDGSGALLSIAADAWSAPEVGFVAGVATLPAARGQGLSRQVCAFVTAELLKRHGRVALMVDAANAAAISVYQRLGYTYRAVAAASAAA
jgi:ribosomal protein S18 acetylase RimI-like enzyme